MGRNDQGKITDAIRYGLQHAKLYADTGKVTSGRKVLEGVQWLLTAAEGSGCRGTLDGFQARYSRLRDQLYPGS